MHKGISGPITIMVGLWSLHHWTRPETSSALISRHWANWEIPALPGAQKSLGWRLDLERAQQIACSRPPEPTTRISTVPPELVLKVSIAGKDHRDAMLVSGLNHFLVPDASASLNDGGNPCLGAGINGIPKGQKRIGGHNTSLGFLPRLL